MTPFGLRARLKSAIKSALGVHEPPRSASAPSTRPAPAQPAPSAPSAPPAPPVAAPKPSPTPAAAPRPSIGASPPAPAVGGPGGTMWVQAARMDEVLPGSSKVVSVFGKKYALFEADGELFATVNACPHAGGQLGEGDLEGHTITCPFHAFQYDVRTGQCLGGQVEDVETVRVKVDGDLILLEV